MNKIAKINPYISKITLNTNELNSPIKDTMTAWIKKKIQLHVTYKRLTLALRVDLNVKRWKKLFDTNDKQKRDGIDLLMPDNIDFQSNCSQEKKNIKIWGSSSRDTTIMYFIKFGVLKYIEETLTELKIEIESKAIIVGNIRISFTTLDRVFRQRMNKEGMDSNNALDLIDLTDI